MPLAVTIQRWMRAFSRLDGRVTAREWRLGIAARFAVSICGTQLISRWLGAGTFTAECARFVWFIGLLYPFICLSAQRFQDRGKPGEFALAAALPAALQALINTGAGFPGGTALGALFGGITLITFVWFVIELGFGGTVLRAQTAAPRPRPQTA